MPGVRQNPDRKVRTLGARSKDGARSRSRSRPRMRPFLVVALVFALSAIALLVWAAIARATAPMANTTRPAFDAIIVLGTPSDNDGNPTPAMLDRISEGVREYKRGVAPRIVVTGAAAHNRFVEAHVMAQVAEAQGVPRSQIFEESQALDTIQNACYSSHILAAHGWQSAEVVSSASHLPRASMIFSRLFSREPGGSWQWRMHPTPGTLGPGAYDRAAATAEVLKTARYLVWSRWVEPCEPQP